MFAGKPVQLLRLHPYHSPRRDFQAVLRSSSSTVSNFAKTRSIPCGTCHICYVSFCLQAPLNTYKHKNHRGNNFGTSHYERQRNLSKHSAVAQMQRFVTRDYTSVGALPCVLLLLKYPQFYIEPGIRRPCWGLLWVWWVFVCLFVLLALFEGWGEVSGPGRRSLEPAR